MKRALLLIIAGASFLGIYSQDCILNAEDIDTIPVSYAKAAYKPGSSTPIKYIKLTFHFMLKTDGTGNFLPTGDGYGNDYTGYDHARATVNFMNARLANNQQMHLPIGNNTDVLPTRIRFIVTGVYFHDLNNSHYYYNQSYTPLLNSTYGIDNTCNIFYVGSVSASKSNSGHANLGGFGRYVKIKDYWETYYDSGNYNTYISTNGTIHELMHNLGLSHTLFTPGGLCCDGSSAQYCDDGLSDTPTWEYIVNTLGQPSPCCWNGSTCSNNILDYNTHRNSLTPEQLAIIHEVLDGTMYDYTLRSHNSDITICDIGYPNLIHIGKNIIIGGVTCNPQSVTLEANEEVTIKFNESVTINSEFEIESGAIFTIEQYDII